MSDDPDDWRKPWVYDGWLQEKLRRDKEWQKEHRAEAERRRMERINSGFKSLAPAPPSRDPEVREARLEEFKDNPKLRNWAIWKRYKAGGTTLKKVGDEFGITPVRVRQIVTKYDRKLRYVLNPDINKQWDNVSDEAREATLGVEFVFRNDLTFRFVDGDQRGWDQLEPSVHMASAYGNSMTGWEPEWGQQDTSPTKPKPAYTYYKTLIEKEQTND
jgi:hypothetical protein